jgi:PPOX class probable F420-dependent enzyme
MDAPAQAPTLPPSIRAFLDAPRFASIATLDPDGSPRQALVWYLLDGDDVIVNSAEGRRWPANLRRDPRISLTVVDQADGYSWVGLVGTVTEIIDDQPRAQADIARMARTYHADDPDYAARLIAGRFERQHRVSFRIRVTGIHDHLED